VKLFKVSLDERLCGAEINSINSIVEKGKTIKYPYGISEFRSIISENYFYCDRTDKSPLLAVSIILLMDCRQAVTKHYFVLKSIMVTGL